MKAQPAKKSLNTYQKILGYGVCTILILMPFHGIISVVGGKLSGHMSLVQAWKEALLIGLLGVAAVGLTRQRLSWPKLDLVNKSVLGVLTVALLVAIIKPVGLNAMAFGVKTDLSMFLIFGLAQLAAPFFNQDKLFGLIVWPATIVAVLALLQVYAIPFNWLTALGYSPTTINPVQLVDPALWFVRAFSTLGGPNQLGAYLILPASLLIGWIIQRRAWLYIVPLVVMLTAIVLSFSRSSWLGMIVAGLISIFLLLRSRARWLFAMCIALVVIVGALLIIPIVKSSNNNLSQYVLLHGRVFETKIEGSDAGRISSAQKSLQLILENPLGLGLGKAGPASIHAGNAPIITENWYLQIALELGVIGLAAYLVFFAMSGIWLYRSSQKNRLISTGLLASLIGILVANLFLHTWADSSLALVFFAAFGIQKGLVG